GNDINCAVWLGLPSQVQGVTFPFSRWVQQTPDIARTPMYFLYGSEDGPARTTAARFEQALKQTHLAIKHTAQIPIKEARKLSGKDLLGRPLPTEDLIVKYVARVLDERGPNTPQQKTGPRLTEVPLDRYFQTR